MASQCARSSRLATVLFLSWILDREVDCSLISSPRVLRGIVIVFTRHLFWRGFVDVRTVPLTSADHAALVPIGRHCGCVACLFQSGLALIVHWALTLATISGRVACRLVVARCLFLQGNPPSRNTPISQNRFAKPSPFAESHTRHLIPATPGAAIITPQ